jgi:hypothetical protein
MDLAWADVGEPLVAGLAGIVGIRLAEEALRVLRRQGRCPERWARDRTRKGRGFRDGAGPVAGTADVSRPGAV